MSTVPTESNVHTSTPAFEPRPVPLPVPDFMDSLKLGSLTTTEPDVAVSVGVNRYVDEEGSIHSVQVYDQSDVGWSFPLDDALKLIVLLAQAYTAAQLDRSEDGDAHTEAYGSAGSVWDLSGFESVVGSQRFPFEGEPTEHNVVLRGYDATFSTDSIPELVRLLLVATADACTGSTEERAA
ncbi:hypothetical protein [Rhodococcus cercidiphylli]|uniref:Uncharacterized protein n=1 Tax=Rhodococcus cercidiphylli TaxID=489916 RepID=A0ABU4B0D9_9NOCA|nr:hypothetical protein [Rhodococcus cercidiphylli]MDV6231926.1 hypothetical protein [Rhodococcus cercidiphylli]